MFQRNEKKNEQLLMVFFFVLFVSKCQSTTNLSSSFVRARSTFTCSLYPNCGVWLSTDITVLTYLPLIFFPSSCLQTSFHSSKRYSITWPITANNIWPVDNLQYLHVEFRRCDLIAWYLLKMRNYCKFSFQLLKLCCQGFLKKSKPNCFSIV